MVGSGKDNERRKFVRLKEQDVVLCELFSAESLGPGKKTAKFHAFTKDVAEGGLLFETDAFFDLGTLLRLEIDIPGWERFKSEFYKDEGATRRHPLVVLARVVRVEDIGERRYDIGVAFKAVDSGHKLALQKYVQRMAGK